MMATAEVRTINPLAISFLTTKRMSAIAIGNKTKKPMMPTKIHLSNAKSKTTDDTYIFKTAYHSINAILTHFYKQKDATRLLSLNVLDKMHKKTIL